MLLHLDSSLSNQAAHFLSRLTPGWLPCAKCAQCNDMPGSNYFYHPHKGKGYETHHMLTFYTDFIFHFKCRCELAHVDSPESLKEKFQKKLQLKWEVSNKESTLTSYSIFSTKQIYAYNFDTDIFFLSEWRLRTANIHAMMVCHIPVLKWHFSQAKMSYEQEATHDIVLCLLLDLI